MHLKICIHFIKFLCEVNLSLPRREKPSSPDERAKNQTYMAEMFCSGSQRLAFGLSKIRTLTLRDNTAVKVFWDSRVIL